MTDDTLRRQIALALIKRAKKLDFSDVYDLVGDEQFILAGGALCGDAVNDFDIYPVRGHAFSIDSICAKASETAIDRWETISYTKNALTIRLKKSGQIVQFCRYMKNSLNELVDSFDFSHIQAGVRFPGRGAWPNPDGVYFTDAFVVASVSRSTEYVGSEYPLSSIIRCAKYHKRGRLTRVEVGKSVLNAMKDMLCRGFEDYDDFKDQLDAIDLGMPDFEGSRALYDKMLDIGLIGKEGQKKDAEVKENENPSCQGG